MATRGVYSRSDLATSSVARLVRNWRTATDMEILSDYRYIVDLVVTPQKVFSRRRDAERSRSRR